MFVEGADIQGDFRTNGHEPRCCLVRACARVIKKRGLLYGQKAIIS